MATTLVPALDAAGLPGPSWLFHVLLVFTFFLHMLFMNLTLGGTLLAWFAHVRSGGRAGDPGAVLAARMMRVNAFAISLTITTGVAPLLFVQVIYQPFFYAGTILLGWIWFAMLVLLIAGYYATYLYKFRGVPAGRAGGGAWLGLSALAFVLIAMIHVAVHLVHVQPDNWPAFAANPWSVLADPTYWPRLGHFVFAGIAFSALVLGWWAARRAAAGEEVEVNVAIAKSCWRWALWTTALQVLDGFLLLALLPSDVLAGVMRGGVATLAPLTLSVLLAIGLLMMLGRPFDPIRQRGLLSGTLGAMLLTVAIMSVTRHQVRALYLAPATAATRFDVAPQWGNFGLFVVVLLVSLAVVGVMVRRVLTERASGTDAA